MSQAFLIIQIIIAAILIGMILVQSKGTGLGRAWGGGSGTSFTRRGLEKLMYRATFAVSTIFIVLSIVQIFVS